MQLITGCPLCGSTDLRERFKARDPHYGIPGEFRIVRCAKCSLQFVNPMYSDEELASLYPADYYAFRETTKPAPWKARLKKALGYWQGTKEPGFPKPGIFLDVGCGGGEFVARMRRLGWESYGIEVNGPAAAAGRSLGLQIVSGTVQEAKFPPEYFDYVRASHSLEHMPNPHETLKEISRILKPGAVLLVAAPNVHSAASKVYGPYWWHLCPPIHPFGYSARTLRQILAQHGLRTVRIVFNSDYVGILGSLQIWLNRASRRGSSVGAVFNCRPLRVLAGWTQHVCDLIRQGDMIEVTARKVSS